ncbi:sensor histidine kinase [Halomicrobium salinisoli]|uniref:sensor histidine kinase n=1 Tax=Halomicrobium salinisoli TaxID=2878391 RepID=UPI001CEFC877|nr:ATP-binding protein [Halomicrobium salinisoli]
MSGPPLGIGGVAGGEQQVAGHWRRVLPVLGVLVLVTAIARSAFTLADTGILLEAALDLLLVGTLGAVMLYIGLRLPTTAVRPAYYPRIVLWVVGGVTVMAVVLALRVLHPGVSVQFTFGTQAVFLAIGSLAGLGIGVHEARALDQARRLEEQNAELKRTERKLEEAVTELEASNEQLEQFAYAASHDLQEPLRMVRKYLELVEGRYADDLDDDGREFLAFALDGAERMDETMTGLLEYARVDAEGDPSGRVDLDDVLDDALTDLQVRIEESDAEVTREPLPTVDGDEHQLRQVFQNLLDNAVEYSGDEPPRVHVGAERCEARNASNGSGDRWAVSVRDEGVGIDPDDAERVFGVFERLDEAGDRSGSGIGLALCERIAERHGGEIRVDAEPGEGSTFTVVLPA